MSSAYINHILDPGRRIWTEMEYQCRIYTGKDIGSQVSRGIGSFTSGTTKIWFAHMIYDKLNVGSKVTR